MSRRGVTLVETALCTFLIACVALAVAGLFVGSARALRHSSQRAQAAALVDQAVEQVRANGFGQLNLGIQPLPPVTQDGVTYEGEREILDLTNPATPGHLLKRVRVTVRWKDRKGTNQLVRESWLSALKS